MSGMLRLEVLDNTISSHYLSTALAVEIESAVYLHMPAQVTEDSERLFALLNWALIIGISVVCKQMLFEQAFFLILFIAVRIRAMMVTSKILSFPISDLNGLLNLNPFLFILLDDCRLCLLCLVRNFKIRFFQRRSERDISAFVLLF